MMVLFLIVHKLSSGLRLVNNQSLQSSLPCELQAEPGTVASVDFFLCCFRKRKVTAPYLSLQPFGVNQPGPYIMYTTVDANGYSKNGSGIASF